METVIETSIEPVVFLEKLQQASDSVADQFSRAFQELSIIDNFNRANAVFIKPNLTYPVYKRGVTTRREFVESLVAALREINSRTKIYIGEGEGGYNSFSMSDAMNSMGYGEMIGRYPNVEIVNLTKVPSKSCELTARHKPYFIDLPCLFFDEIDFSITCPLPKVHCMTGVTLAFKNQWGCLPDTMRLKNHFVFNELISQIGAKLKFKYAFLDGKYGLDINGPMAGRPIEVNWFVASNSLGAFDMIVAEMMGFDWRKIGHLKMAARNNCLPARDQINLVGDIAALKRKFVLKRDVWAYPALTGFHSRILTHLFYFSPLAKPLHDIMYTFRKKPLDS